MKKYKKIIIHYYAFDKSLSLRFFRHNFNIKRTVHLLPYEPKYVKWRFLMFSILYTQLCDTSLRELKASGRW